MDNREFCPSSGKVSYPTRARARMAATEVSGRKGGAALQHFECDHCGLWHIGRPAGRRTSTVWRYVQRSNRLAQGGHHV